MTHSAHVKLAAHAANPARFHQTVDVVLRRQSEGGLDLLYAIHGLNLDLRVPTPHHPAPAEALWRTTCCELFLAPLGQNGYREFNFSPAGQVAVYGFSDTRQRLPGGVDCPPPALDWVRSEDRMTLHVSLPKGALPAATDTWRVAVAVILEAAGGHLGYWALAHPPGQADFHHHTGFVLSLGPAGFRPTRWP